MPQMSTYLVARHDRKAGGVYVSGTPSMMRRLLNFVGVAVVAIVVIALCVTLGLLIAMFIVSWMDW